MAITRLFQAGADVDGVNSELVEWGAYNYLFASSGVAAKTGAYSYTFYHETDWARVTIPTTRQVRGGFHWRGSVPSNTSGAPGLFSIRTGTTEHVAVKGADAAPLQPDLILVVQGTERGRVVGAYTPGVWTLLTFDVKIDASAGWVRVWRDGTLLFTWDGNTGSTDADNYMIGTDTISSVYRWNSANYIDDLYLDDVTGEVVQTVSPPDLRFALAEPDSNGNYSQWMGSDADQVDNYELVDDRPHDGDSTYVEADAADELDTYGLALPTIPTGATIAAVIPLLITRKTDGGTASQVATLIRESATDDTGTAQDLTTSYALIWERHTTAPAGGAWDVTKLAAAEVGAASKGTF